MDFTQLLDAAVMLVFRSDMEQALAASLSLRPSQVQTISVQSGSVVLDVLAVASDASSLAALDAALGKMTADPMAAFGSTLTTKYGITGATLTVRYPYLPPSPPRPPAPPHSPPSPPMALHAEDVQGEPECSG